MNKNKQKGSRFEHEAVVYLNNNIKRSDWKRIPGSGAMGTTLGEPFLTSDITGKIESFTKKIKAECKAGYNTLKEVKSFSVKKEWLDKIKKEANDAYAFPMLFAKFDNARDGVKKIAIMDIDDFIYLMNYITDLKSELDLTYEKLRKE